MFGGKLQPLKRYFNEKTLITEVYNNSEKPLRFQSTNKEIPQAYAGKEHRKLNTPVREERGRMLSASFNPNLNLLNTRGTES